MDNCIKIIAAITMVSPLAAGRAYGGNVIDRHQGFHHFFEEHAPQLWHPGHAIPDSHSNEGWQAGYHQRHYQRQFPRGSHQDREYWQAYPSNWIHPWGNMGGTRRSDWGSSDSPRQSNWGNWGHWGNTGNNGQSSWGTSGNAEDRYPQWSQWSPASRRTTTTTTASPSAQSQQRIQACIRTCPTTPEYNPVCGSNNITYSNPGRLECARFCGVDVVLQRRATCNAQTTQLPITPQRTPTTTSSTTTTVPPITPTRITTTLPEVPSRFPNIDNTQSTSSTTERFTIPPNVLSSIFTTTPSEPDIDIDIDIRTRNGDMDK